MRCGVPVWALDPGGRSEFMHGPQLWRCGCRRHGRCRRCYHLAGSRISRKGDYYFSFSSVCYRGTLGLVVMLLITATLEGAVTWHHTNYPSIFNTCHFLRSGLQDLLEPLPGVNGWRQGDTLHKWPVHCRVTTESQPFALSHTPAVNLEFPIHLACMNQDCGRKPGNTDWCHGHRERTRELLAGWWSCDPLDLSHDEPRCAAFEIKQLAWNSADFALIILVDKNTKHRGVENVCDLCVSIFFLCRCYFSMKTEGYW